MTGPRVVIAALAGLLVAGGIGFSVGRITPARRAPAASSPESMRKALYWYDPMVPGQHFDKPGKSPFMDMQLVPKYADEPPGATGVQIDPGKVQNLGVRLATVERGSLLSGVSATGVIAFNERDVAVVQAKAAGFVQRVYARAPGDTLAAGAPLADLLVPEWGGAQGEYLAVKRTGDPALIQASRERLKLLGMPPALIEAVERSGHVRNIVTVSTPTGGVIKTLGVRNGMSVMAGQTLAEVNGLSRIWLNASIPEAMAGQIRPGESVAATLPAFPGETFNGRVTAILPQTDAASHTLTARIDLPNPGGRLKPGMFASAQFGGMSQPALLVPSEAVIRTGTRSLVMIAQPGGRYAPAEVRIGREAGGKTEVLAGLSEGEKVVASGQFLIDSEASLSGIQARPVTSPPAPASARSPKPNASPAKAPALYESVGRVEQISPASVALSHQPVPAIGWPAMTMTFKLADPALAQGVKVGDRVAFAFDQPPAGPTVRRMSKATAP
jgi:Cu(I)/Ag(I) efflux system membrane fusion protein